MKYAKVALIPLVLLASCGKGDVDMKNASVAEVAKTMEDQQKLDPGAWSTTVEIIDVKLSGLDPKDAPMAEAMSRAMKGQKKTIETCLTPEQSKKSVTEMFAGRNADHCSYESFKMSDGNMDAVMTCAPPGTQGKMTLSMKGRYGADSYDMAVQMVGSGMPGSPPGAGMTMVGKNSGKRTGDCKKG
jgi:hypothetical protein